MLSKGQHFERNYSEVAHRKRIALLVSPDFLRKHHMGQIDVAYLDRGKIIVAECKSGFSSLGHYQRRRLKSSTRFLSLLLERPASLFLVTKFAKSEKSAYPFNIKKIGELAWF